MSFVEILMIVGSICSIVSVLLSVFIATKVVKIVQVSLGGTRIHGDRNIAAGKDMTIGR